MAFLDPADPMRKSRKSSMLMLKAASQMNLAALDAELIEQHSQRLLVPERSTGGHGNSHGHGHGHHKTSSEESTVMGVSALYGNLLVVIGMGFPIAESLSSDLPVIFYNSFYLYLYFGSIIFLMFAYIFVLSNVSIPFKYIGRCCREIKEYIKPFTTAWSKYLTVALRRIFQQRNGPILEEATESVKSCTDFSRSTELNTMNDLEGGGETNKSKYSYTESAGHGSMYLKMGTIIFGIGSMIYSGLVFGQYFELRTDCSDILMAVTPATRMLFTFVQMYFIFLNSRVSISRHTTIARFGIMHMVATNLCIWLNVLVQETKHTIHHVTHGHRDDHGINAAPEYLHQAIGHEERSIDGFDTETYPKIMNDFAIYSAELLNDSADMHSFDKKTIASDSMQGCRIVNLMGDLVTTSAPLLFPCTIEYSLLCASVLYVMWKNVQVGKSVKKESNEDAQLSNFIARKVRHLYSVDCGRASRGLFMGIFVLVLTLISLITFYVLISTSEFEYLGILAANLTEIILYSVGTISAIIGMRQMRELGFIEEEEIELDNILLVIAQGGVYMFMIFTLIGAYFSREEVSVLPLATALITLIQATIQTLYILDASRRCCRTKQQLKRKSGREMVTFLLVLNLSMWLCSTFQTSRAELHVSQQEFYGIWAWTIISHVSMPLGIFYRFHVTVCLGEIWKRAYKLRTEE